MQKGLGQAFIDLEIARVKMLVRILPVIITVIAIITGSILLLEDKFRDYAIIILVLSLVIGAIINVAVDKKFRKLVKLK